MLSTTRSNMIFIFLIFCVLSNELSQCELFTAIADFENTLRGEETVLDWILHYVERREADLSILRRFSEESDQIQKRFQSSEKLLHHPIEIFHSIERLTNGWNIMKSIMQDQTYAEEAIANITERRKHEGIQFPTQEDITGAAIGLFRLQDAYNLSAQQLAAGNISGLQGWPKLSAGDCFDLGMEAYNLPKADFYHALLWFQEAYEKLKTEVEPTVNELDLVDYLSFCMYEQSNLERAAFLAKKLKSSSPSYEHVDENLAHYSKKLKEQGIDWRQFEDETALPPIRTNRAIVNYPGFGDFLAYEALCRGENTVKKLGPDVYCYYKNNNPFLRLAPFKTEIVHTRPKLMLYHGVISPTESTVVRELVAPKLARAMVANIDGGLEPAAYRISKSGWLTDDEHVTVETISRRIEGMTDLSMESAEGLQLNTYGIGGHYETHYDFAQKHERHSFKREGGGNRIATVLFYLTEPSAGGATVFPFLNVTLYPSENDAVVWYNLYKNGEGDLSLLHAACPVLSGIKWVANKWLHEHGQEFYRPCALNEDEYE